MKNKKIITTIKNLFCEFSKVLTLAVLAYVLSVLDRCMDAIVDLASESSLEAMIVGGWACVTAIVASYMWRAKSKDKLDWRKEYGNDVYEDADIQDE